MVTARLAKTITAGANKQTKDYDHPEATVPLRPDAGTQAQFKKKKPPKVYKYDSSLAPELVWDGQNPAREQGEALITQILESDDLKKAKQAAQELKTLSQPFLNWAGKAERLSFEVPTLPLFVHERLSTKTIIETLKSHRKDAAQLDIYEMIGDPHHSITDQLLKAYEYQDKWTNRVMLGDSLVCMNSLLHYENLGGQVQMIYMDPPYGVKFGSNFQPFVRRRDVKHNDDDNMTREPEMVKAYRDTWELGLHSYLTYMRDRLLLSRELLKDTGSIFVQISDENVHHVRELMDEIFGLENFQALIAFQKSGGAATKRLEQTFDFILWYSKDDTALKYYKYFISKKGNKNFNRDYCFIDLVNGQYRRLTNDEITDDNIIPEGTRRFRLVPCNSQDYSNTRSGSYKFDGVDYYPGKNRHWSVSPEGLDRAAQLNRLVAVGNSLMYKLYVDESPGDPIDAVWTDTAMAGLSGEKFYVVQTNTKVIERCMLMTTSPGDLVLDPTCGSGTTAYVAEQWGRRWITCDVSRVPLALAKQRLLTATFPYFKLKDPKRGPAGGFEYLRRQNRKGEEVGGIVPHITLESIANNQPPKEEVLVDRPEKEEENKIIRVAGPFSFEATIPTPVDWEGDGVEDSGTSPEERNKFIERMLEVLRLSPVIQLPGNRTLAFKNIRPPIKSLSLSAEAVENDKAVAFVFGPENGAVSEKLVYEAAREAHAKGGYVHLYVIGFAIQPNARQLVDNCEQTVGIPATYVQMTPDIMMGDLLKNMRTSQIFSVCGLPDIKVNKSKDDSYQVELLGLDTFDPATMNNDHIKGDEVPAWFLDSDYNGLCFHVTQAFFPRTGAWESLKKALRGAYDEGVWDHLAGTVSAPFSLGEHKTIAVKVIDDRGNELIVTKKME
ncbi:MAG: DNA methylase [Candidatus Edwardsbacteria bacterium RIFOXYD12_FULL_50_11]|uniref:DNA methylase n=1 Tax=Candidatus Edwardsbacteria bacterium GWF2_54_11 TaxID=1817851 RepID=A0A1F5RDV0_9BACT|nr:MAG: DNA methylase [Candidatus Edwardsbacteria bacterium RifOxyC12_full_54_24]OGF08006.1 MAG: DNA methylase [Candidatus Edwardsbacteria bacterium RifOxyA12_full_54_48]OGF10255.1 MAG: DNA methylase [Candidatus Edwardsbacteria bacterium GWE2_54_12]OGF12241.1 MAG: DNA methylase [Candidatus Edwardsbacteria bacterium GWF2_54_11]OGF18157.1 MAG: DNA methylase [Candidatus Edwardsbacteria bacterium RIFOXYD12_FULL_50_11]OGJ19817.1 MAG: DNA methylase [Candidatus Edwardsbacteria bacterium RifOxyB12_ful